MPIFLKPYFWDVDFNNLKLDSNKEFIISRLLEKGRIECYKWLLGNYSKDEISQIISSGYNISSSTQVFASYLLK